MKKQETTLEKLMHHPCKNINELFEKIELVLKSEEYKKDFEYEQNQQLVYQVASDLFSISQNELLNLKSIFEKFKTEFQFSEEDVNKIQIAINQMQSYQLVIEKSKKHAEEYLVAKTKTESLGNKLIFCFKNLIKFEFKKAFSVFVKKEEKKSLKASIVDSKMNYIEKVKAGDDKKRVEQMINNNIYSDVFDESKSEEKEMIDPEFDILLSIYIFSKETSFIGKIKAYINLMFKVLKNKEQLAELVQKNNRKFNIYMIKNGYNIEKFEKYKFGKEQDTHQRSNPSNIFKR